MKRFLLTTLWLLLFAVVSVCAQDHSRPTTSASAAVRQAAAKSVMISGRVSNDGRRFSIDSDNEWDVSNAKALKGHEGGLVTVKCYVDSIRNRIEIVSVNRVQPEVR
jgi:hypothetical protein